MAEILTQVGLVATSVISVATSTITFVVGQPVLLIPVIVGFVGTGIALVRKFL